MTGRSKAHRTSKRKEEEFSDWGPWEWNLERACWMRKRENAKGDINYQYGESNQPEPDRQPRNSPAPQQEGLLPRNLTEIDYSTGENYRYAQGFDSQTNENVSTQESENYPESGLPSQNPLQSNPDSEIGYLPAGRDSRASASYPSHSEERFYTAPLPLISNPAQNLFPASSQIHRPIYPRSYTIPHISSSGYGPDDQSGEEPPNLESGEYPIYPPASSRWENTGSEQTQSQPNPDAPFSQSAFPNPATQRIDATYKLTREFASANLNDPLESPSRMRAPSFNTAGRPEIQPGIYNEDSFDVQQTVGGYNYRNLKSESGQTADSYCVEGAENDPLVNEKPEDQGRLSKSKSTTNIVTKDPKAKTDPLFKEYHVHKSDAFKIGKIFKMLWSEPYGGGTNNEDLGTRGTDELRIRDAKYGERVYSTIRRFVIVRAKRGHCLCVPILTYGNQGTAKPGVKAEYHAIIYTSEKAPQQLAGEPKLHKKPVRAVVDQKSERLRPESRVNYSKTYTVEHNVKVVFIGKIHKDSEATFFADFKRVFDD